MAGEHFVDVTYRGIDIGARLRISPAGPGSAYLEHPTPMPVGTELVVAVGDELRMPVQVSRVQEQVAGADKPPGMHVRALAGDESARAWWHEMLSAAADAAMAEPEEAAAAEVEAAAEPEETAAEEAAAAEPEETAAAEAAADVQDAGDELSASGEEAAEAASGSDEGQGRAETESGEELDEGEGRAETESGEDKPRGKRRRRGRRRKNRG